MRTVPAMIRTDDAIADLLDIEGGVVFQATEGLNKEQIGVASLAPGEGLVGQVALREEPLNLEYATGHSEFRLLPGLGEEPFQSFLGVPIIHHREVLGVLVVQQKERRRFDESEEAFLVTMSAQLAVMIASAASAAAPIAKPLPIAAVVLPSSSSESVILRVSSPRPDISAMPPALSATGP